MIVKWKRQWNCNTQMKEDNKSGTSIEGMQKRKEKWGTMNASEGRKKMSLNRADAHLFMCDVVCLACGDDNFFQIGVDMPHGFLIYFQWKLDKLSIKRVVKFAQITELSDVDVYQALRVGMPTKFYKRILRKLQFSVCKNKIRIGLRAPKNPRVCKSKFDWGEM